MEIKERIYSKRTFSIVVISSLIFIVTMCLLIFIPANKHDQFSIDSNSVISSKDSNENANQDDNVVLSDGTISENDKNANADVSDVIIDEIEHGWVINNYGYTYIYGDSGYQQFNYKQTALQRYVDSLNRFSKIVPEKTTVFNIIVPVSSTFASIPSEIYKEDNFFNLSQSSFVSTVSSKTDDTIVNVPIVDALENAYDNGEYVYFRTDNNWTPLGAYKCYRAYCENAGITPFDLETFTSKYEGDFLGSYYTATASDSMFQNPDKFISYSSAPEIYTKMYVYDGETVYSDYSLGNNEVSTQTRYNIYLGREAGRYEICSNAEGGNLLIIGDSSVAPMLPFLASHYAKIDYINPKKFKTPIAEFLASREYDHLITMCYSTNAVAGDFIPALNILTGESGNE